MAEIKYLMEILDELKVNAGKVKEEEIEKAADLILTAKRIFVAGAGRSGYAARALSNRLMHLGLDVYFVGEPTTPAIREDDLLIIGSGSGETGSLVVMARKAAALRARILTVTIHPEAAIGQLAAACIVLPGATPKSELEDTCITIQPMGNAFEQMTWLVYDVLIMYLMRKMNKTEDEMYLLHANLE